MIGAWFRKRAKSPILPWSIDDPTPRLKDSPYTFFVPQPERIALLQPGDLVKLIFKYSDPSRKWDAEKMWVEVTDIGTNAFVGNLANLPDDMPQLKPGDRVEFEKRHIIDIKIANPERLSREQIRSLPKDKRQYWDRCLVDQCVLRSGVPVGYIYREALEETEEATMEKDSGWRIRGDVNHPNFTEDDVAYVALGAVLNKDDSWVQLIDEPAGSAFVRDFVSNSYVRAKA